MGKRQKSGRLLISQRGSGLWDSIANATGSVLNKAIDLLPVELHAPGYKFCGPGTRLKERLARGDKPINKLDEYCRDHDIAYSQSGGDSGKRAAADRILADRAWERVKAADSGLKERSLAYVVTNLMKVKSHLGGGMRRRKSTRKRKQRRQRRVNTGLGGRGLYLRPYKPQTGSGHRRRKKNK